MAGPELQPSPVPNAVNKSSVQADTSSEVAARAWQAGLPPISPCSKWPQFLLFWSHLYKAFCLLYRNWQPLYDPLPPSYGIKLLPYSMKPPLHDLTPPRFCLAPLPFHFLLRTRSKSSWQVQTQIGLIWVKEEGKTGFSEGWQGCSEGFPEGEARKVTKKKALKDCDKSWSKSWVEYHIFLGSNFLGQFNVQNFERSYCING